MSSEYPFPPLPEQKQSLPGSFLAMDPRPDHGEDHYRGSGRLAGKKPSSPAATPVLAARSPSPMPTREPMS
ncbi:hypothetical protein SODG_001217 [Sodalis praecaptivus]